MGTTTTIKEFANLICDLLYSDNYCLVALGGFTGKGKSTLSIHLQQEVSNIMNKPWSFKENCTWSRKEFLIWVQGKGKTSLSKEDKLIEARKKPEYTSILPDELFSMFYKRNWNQDSQKEAIGLLNMCRDRHLFIAGNVPNFWDLDGGFLSRVMYYVYLPTRGRAWIFEQEENPFSPDPWNVSENRKAFRKNRRTPYKLPNFVAELNFPDLGPDEKEKYLQIRNTKRVQAQEDIKKEKVESFSKIKQDRDNLIRALNLKHKISQKDIASYCSLKKSQVSNICLGITN